MPINKYVHLILCFPATLNSAAVLADKENAIKLRAHLNGPASQGNQMICLHECMCACVSILPHVVRCFATDSIQFNRFRFVPTSTCSHTLQLLRFSLNEKNKNKKQNPHTILVLVAV